MSLILSFPNTTSMWMLRSKQLIENITKTHIRKCQKNRVKKNLDQNIQISTVKLFHEICRWSDLKSQIPFDYSIFFGFTLCVMISEYLDGDLSRKKMFNTKTQTPNLKHWTQSTAMWCDCCLRLSDLLFKSTGAFKYQRVLLVLTLYLCFWMNKNHTKRMTRKFSPLGAAQIDSWQRRSRYDTNHRQTRGITSKIFTIFHDFSGLIDILWKLIISFDAISKKKTLKLIFWHFFLEFHNRIFRRSK